MASFGQMPVVEEQQRYARGLATREDNDSHYDEARRSRTVQRYARMHVQKLTLGQMVAYGRDMTEGKLIKSARHLHRELPVRLAQRIVDFQSQPYAVISNPYFKQVFRMYHDAFDRFRSFPNITNMEEERRFTKLVETMVAEHISVIPILGKGLAEVRGYSSVESDFMDRLLMTRISRRVLAEQHIALHKALHKAKLRRNSTMTKATRDTIGVIRLECRLEKTLRRCFDKAATICERTYGYHPRLEIEGQADAALSYIPVHLEYMILELMKNAMRGTVEFAERQSAGAGAGAGAEFYTELMASRPIVATLAQADGYASLRLSDRGGGIPPAIEDEVWNYGYSSVGAVDDHVPDASAVLGGFGAGGIAPNAAVTDPDPIAGLGFGLPLAQCYARYFGGSIRLSSMPGHGTDALLRLNTSGEVVEQVALL